MAPSQPPAVHVRGAAANPHKYSLPLARRTSGSAAERSTPAGHASLTLTNDQSAKDGSSPHSADPAALAEAVPAL